MSGQVSVACNDGEGIGVFKEPAPLASNSVFFFVGSPMTIFGASVVVTGVDFFQQLTTGALLGDVMENVPYGEYSYSISVPCYEPINGIFTVD